MIKGRLISFLGSEKKYIFFEVICRWVGLLLQIAMVISIAIIVGRWISYRTFNDSLYIYIAIIFAGMAGRFATDIFAARNSYMSSHKVKELLRDKIYEKLLEIGPSYRQSVSTSQVVQVTTEGVEQLEIYFSRYLPQFFYSMVAFLTLFVTMAIFSLKVGLVLLFCVPLIPLSIMSVQKIAKRLLSKYWGVYTGLGDSFLESVQGLTTLKIYQADGIMADRMDRQAENFRKITMKVLTMQLNSITIMDFVAYGGAAAGMLTALWEYTNDRLSIIGTIAMILLAAEYFVPLRLLGSFFHIAMNGMAAADKIFDLLNKRKPARGNEKVSDITSGISLSDVSFSYDDKRAILKNIEMEFTYGRLTAIVGRSGCGKSTLAGILAGKNTGFKGDIAIGDKNQKTLSESAIKKTITYVGHDSYIFKGTVRYNLLMGRTDIDDNELKEILQQVNLWEFLKNNQGLDTFIQEGGANLSGGQRQRLAMARAIIKDTPVYIFDEATSSIDVESENIIMSIIKKMAGDKTIIVISHRLANVIDAYKIYMMQDGEVVEKGTHSTLMEKDGEYANLFLAQEKLESYRRSEIVQ